MAEQTEGNKDFTKSQIQKYRMLFNLIDQDGDEKISVKDLQAAANDVSLNLDDSVVKDMLKSGGGKSVDFNTFLKIAAAQFGGFSEESELKDAFTTFDGKDGIDGAVLNSSLAELAETDVEKKAVSEVVDEFTKENKITGYKKFDAEKFIESVKQ